jgi:hypothetical protein
VLIIPHQLQEKHACPAVQPNAEMVVRRNVCARQRLRDRGLHQGYSSTGPAVNAVCPTTCRERVCGWNEWSQPGPTKYLTATASRRSSPSRPSCSAARHRSHLAWLADGWPDDETRRLVSLKPAENRRLPAGCRSQPYRASVGLGPTDRTSTPSTTSRRSSPSHDWACLRGGRGSGEWCVAARRLGSPKHCC